MTRIIDLSVLLGGPQNEIACIIKSNLTAQQGAVACIGRVIIGMANREMFCKQHL